MKIAILPPPFRRDVPGDWIGWLKINDSHVLIQINGSTSETEAKAIFAHLAREP